MFLNAFIQASPKWFPLMYQHGWLNNTKAAHTVAGVLEDVFVVILTLPVTFSQLQQLIISSQMEADLSNKKVIKNAMDCIHSTRENFWSLKRSCSGEWKATNNLLFLRATLQRKWQKSTFFAAKWCFIFPLLYILQQTDAKKPPALPRSALQQANRVFGEESMCLAAWSSCHKPLVLFILKGLASDTWSSMTVKTCWCCWSWKGREGAGVPRITTLTKGTSFW